MKVLKGDYDAYITANGIIPASIMASFDRADHIIEDIEQYADRRRQSIDEEISIEKQNGYNDGFSDGILELSRSMHEFNDAKGALVDGVMPLVRQCLEHVFSRIDVPTVLSALVVEASDKLKDPAPFIVRLHPSNEIAVREKLDAISNDMRVRLPHLGACQIKADETMDEQSCELIFNDQIVLVNEKIAIEGIMKFIDLYYSQDD